jgi:hypothetical protein
VDAGWAHHKYDFWFWKSEIFLLEGLDVISKNQSDGQISWMIRWLLN